jgi:hypothetical protein
MSCPEFIGKSFALRTAVHVAHLKTASYAQHMALGEFYDAIIGKLDRLAEIHLAENPADTFPSFKTSPAEPVAMFEAYLKEVRVEQKGEAAHKAKENIITEIEELTLQTLYKLKRFT